MLRLHRALEPGERLLWSGRPRQGLRLKPEDAFAIPFSLLWVGFAAYGEITIVRDDASWILGLSGLPFLLLGAWLTVGRFFSDRAVRAGTFYGLSDRRLLTVIDHGRGEVRSLALTELPDAHLRERTDRSGDLDFGPRGPVSAVAGTHWRRAPRRLLPLRFEGIPDVRRVQALIREAQRQAASGTGR